MLAGKPYAEHEAAGHIMTMRRDKGRRLIDFAKRTLTDLNRDIREIERHPMRNKKELIEKLDTLKRERRDLAVFMKVMFNIALPGVELAISSAPKLPSDQKPDRPDAASAPPPAGPQ